MIGHQPVQFLEWSPPGLTVRGDFLGEGSGVVDRRLEQQGGQAEEPGGLPGITPTILDRFDREPDGQTDATHVGQAARRRLAEFDAGMVGGPDTQGDKISAQRGRAGAEPLGNPFELELYRFGDAQRDWLGCHTMHTLTGERRKSSRTSRDDRMHKVTTK